VRLIADPPPSLDPSLFPATYRFSLQKIGGVSLAAFLAFAVIFGRSLNACVGTQIQQWLHVPTSDRNQGRRGLAGMDVFHT
jgi:hypothetical protein